MDNKELSQCDGMGLFGWMFIVLFALKLGGVMPVTAWSWWWITMPLWAPFLAVLIFLVIAFLWFFTLGVIQDKDK